MGTDALGFDIQCNQNSGSSCSLSSMYVGHVLVLFMALVCTHLFVLFVALVLVHLLVLFVTLIKLTFVFCGLFLSSSCLHGGGAHCDSGQGDGSCEFLISFF